MSDQINVEERYQERAAILEYCANFSREEAERLARIHRMPPSPDRWKERSKTFQGIADAMAIQWGSPAQMEIAA